MAQPHSAFVDDSPTAEQKRRRAAVEDARSIVGFAGGAVCSEMEALQTRFVDGELTIDEVVATYIRQLRER